MALLNSLVRVIKLHEDERVDIEQFDLMGELSTAAIRRLQQFVGERRFLTVGTTPDISGVEGCVLSAGDAAFAFNSPFAGKMTLSASAATPLEMFIANSVGISGAYPCGDIAQLGTTAVGTFDMPTAGHPRMVMARLYGPIDDAASTTLRRYWDTSVSPPAEANRSDWPSIQYYTLDWVDADASLADADPNSVRSWSLLGYQPVAYLVHGTPPTVSWKRLLPAVGDPTRSPGGELTSIAQTLAAFAKQLETIIGTTWDAIPAVTLQSTYLKDAVQDVRLTALENPGIAAIVKDSSGSQSVDSGTSLQIEFTAADEYDPDDWHSTTVNPDRVTVGESGIYTIDIAFMFGLGIPATGSIKLEVQINGVSEFLSYHGFDYYPTAYICNVRFSTTKYLTSGQFVSCLVTNGIYASGPASLTATLYAARMGVVKVR
jgi:hypothetical protein